MTYRIFRNNGVNRLANLPIRLTLFIACFLGSAHIFAQNPFGDDPHYETDVQRVTRLFNEGKYEACITLGKIADAKNNSESWTLKVARAQLAIGDYAEARQTVESGLERFPNSIRIRWLAEEVYRYNDEVRKSMKSFLEIGELANRSSWRFRDPVNQRLLGKFFLKQRADPKQVLKSFFNPIKKKNPSDPEAYRAIGELALEKHDYAMAAENYQKVVELAPQDPDGLCGLAKSWLPSDSAKANDFVKQALAINPNHADSLLIIADQHVASERYGEAKTALSKIREINSDHPIALAYLAVIAHLENDIEQEASLRKQAMKHWPANPEVDHVIGRELSQKYRFAESEIYQRRSLVYDQNYLPAKMQLAHDLLRIGQDLEGWKLADEVFNADEFSVAAYNLVTLRDEISKFKTIEQDGFIVRMTANEAEIYGQRVLALIRKADEVLTKKYETELEKPIVIEIFPRQQDFAIRTFGMPGGAGYLGVCFGRLITMNSPAALGANLTSWESVLWHEFCHVVTLQKTKNKMPRWLSEGISVYEERNANQAWGQRISIENRKMILGEDLTPVSQLSGAFLRPQSAGHLQFAYYESSLVVEFIVKEFGFDALKKVLEELVTGTPINDTLRRHLAPIEFLDKKFAVFARERANQFAAEANWDEPDPEQLSSPADWIAWIKSRPKNLVGLLAIAQQFVAAKDWAAALPYLEKAHELAPGSEAALPMLARVYRELGRPEDEYKALVDYAALNADSVATYRRLLEISASQEDWEKLKQYGNDLLALNPLIPVAHRYLSMAAEKTNDDALLIQSLGVLAKMGPLDAADVHYQLASALFRGGELASAKRQVIMALEVAPRYREAHALLLKIKAAEVQPDSANDSATQSAEETQ